LNNPGFGGVSLPGEEHNNQGVTKINHTNWTNPQTITLTVPDNCILAIDGILATDQPITYNGTQPLSCGHLVRTADNGTGKILFEGYLQDVELIGNLRIELC